MILWYYPTCVAGGAVFVHVGNRVVVIKAVVGRETTVSINVGKTVVVDVGVVIERLVVGILSVLFGGRHPRRRHRRRRCWRGCWRGCWRSCWRGSRVLTRSQMLVRRLLVGGLGNGLLVGGLGRRRGSGRITQAVVGGGRWINSARGMLLTRVLLISDDVGVL